MSADRRIFPLVAVADVGVAMGPRNRRRFSAGAIVLGVIATLVATALLTRSPGNSSPASSARSARLGGSASNVRLIFGMTPHQVQRLTGKPTTAQGGCWFFRPTQAGMVGSISVRSSFSRLPYDPRTTRDLRLCFLGGAFSSGYLHEFDQRQQKWVWAPWPLALGGGQVGR